MKNRILFIWLFSLVAFSSSAQKTTSRRHHAIVKSKKSLYVKPMFPGGQDSLKSHLYKNLHYPDSAINNNLQGKVIVRFLVDEKGRVVQPEIKQPSPFSLFNEEALRAVQKLPLWYPAKYKGRPVSVYYTLPVIFKFVEG